MREFIIMEKTKTICLALVMIVFGILFISVPETSFDVTIKILAGILTIVGAIWLIGYFLFFKEQIDASQFIDGAFYLGLGLLLFYVPDLYIAIIGIVLSVVGIQYMGSAFDQKRAKAKGWWVDLVYGLVEFVIGATLVILRYSSATHSAVMIYFGVSLILDGLFILAALFTLKRTAKEIKKAIEK